MRQYIFVHIAVAAMIAAGCQSAVTAPSGQGVWNPPVPDNPPTVLPKPPPDPFVVQFSGLPNILCAGIPVRFYVEPTHAAGAVRYTWASSDGFRADTGSLPVVTHAFAAGDYRVDVAAFDDTAQAGDTTVVHVYPRDFRVGDPCGTQ